MKKSITIFLFTMLLTTTLAGCSAKQNVTDAPTTTDIPKKLVLAEKSPWQDSSNLYQINTNAWDNAQASAIYRFQDCILTTYNTYDANLNESLFNLNLVDTETGNIVFATKLSGTEMPEVQILDGKIAVNDIAAKKAFILDAQLNVMHEYQFEHNSFAFDLTADRVYLFTSDSGIQVMDLKTHAIDTIYEEARSIYLAEVNGNYASIIYIDQNTLIKTGAVLNLESGEMTKLSFEKSPMLLEYTDSIYLAPLFADTESYLLGTINDYKVYCPDAPVSVQLINDTSHVLVSSYDEEGKETLTLYDAYGTYISSVKLVGAAALLCEPVWFNEYNGYFLTIMCENDRKDRLLFWDISSETTGENLELSELTNTDSYPEGNSVSKKYYEQAENMSEKYGMKILIANQCQTEFTDHTGELLLEEEDIEIALNTLDETFSSYPEGFFKQLLHDSFTTIEVHVEGRLAKNTSTESEIHVSQGFVYSEGSKILLVLDARGTYESINSTLQQTIYHEISHMIDRKLEFYSQYHEDAVYSDEGWLALNPSGFEYNENYYGTMAPEYSDYFVDHYACSYATEDRARIMEEAAIGAADTFIGRQGLIEKLEYYCKGIRAGFDTNGWPEETFWEKTLNKVK